MKKSILMPFFLCASINLLSCGNQQQTPNNPPQTQIFVSPTGSDLNPGTFQKPVASFERAQALARQLFGSMTDDLVVYFRQGTYRLTKTLEFTSEDSPTNGHRIVYSAYPGEKASISGGITITDWTQGQDKIMIAALDASDFRQLYVNGARAVRARDPNNGSFIRATRVDAENMRIEFEVKYLPEHYIGSELVLLRHWTQARGRVDRVEYKDEQYGWLYLREPENKVIFGYHSESSWFNALPENKVMFFENSRLFLDMPGEWLFDSANRSLLYFPLPEQDIRKSEVIAPQLQTLLHISGAHDLEFSNFTFEHSNWIRPSECGLMVRQGGAIPSCTGKANEMIPAAIVIERSSEIRLIRNVFRHLGGTALSLARGTLNTEVSGNVFSDVSCNGITIYEDYDNPNPPPELRAQSDLISNNYITNVARDYTSCVAIEATYPKNLMITHNFVENLPYSGICVGWGWTGNQTILGGNSIVENKISRVMQLHDDGAGIYTLSFQEPHSKIVGNHIESIQKSPWADEFNISGIFLDEESANWNITENTFQLVDKMFRLSPSSHQNTIENNEIANPPDSRCPGLLPEYWDIIEKIDE